MYSKAYTVTGKLLWNVNSTGVKKMNSELNIKWKGSNFLQYAFTPEKSFLTIELDLTWAQCEDVAL